MTLRGSFDEDLIELFHGELDYLRSAGADFARKYPKLASRLDLGGSESTDPQVERLLEWTLPFGERVEPHMLAAYARVKEQWPVVKGAVLHAYAVVRPYLQGWSWWCWCWCWCWW